MGCAGPVETLGSGQTLIACRRKKVVKNDQLGRTARHVPLQAERDLGCAVSWGQAGYGGLSRLLAAGASCKAAIPSGRGLLPKARPDDATPSVWSHAARNSVWSGLSRCMNVCHADVAQGPVLGRTLRGHGSGLQKHPDSFLELTRLFGVQPVAGIGDLRKAGFGKQGADRVAVFGPDIRGQSTS